jgi:DNA-binding MarR family transcriptional regulator
MLDKRSKEKLESFMQTRKRNLARLIYITHRHFNEWAQKKWIEDGWGEIRPEHLRLISIIGTGEVNINELAKRARVTKQAMSKMVNDLKERGFIQIHPDPQDSRSKIISISSEGADFMMYLCGSAKELEIKFAAIIGKKKTEQLISILSELTEGILELEEQEASKK